MTEQEVFQLRDRAYDLKLLLESVELRADARVNLQLLAFAKSHGLVRGNVGSLEITDLGRQYSSLPVIDCTSLKNLVCENSNFLQPTRVLSGVELQNVESNIANTILGLLLSNHGNIQSVVTPFPRIDLEDPNLGGLVGSAISAFTDPKRRKQLLHSVSPFFTRANGMMEALTAPTTNKVLVRCPSTKFGETNAKELLLHTLRNFDAISGTPISESIGFVDAQSLAELDFTDIQYDHSMLCFFALRYALTGKKDECLDLLPRVKSGKEGRGSIAQQMKEGLCTSIPSEFNELLGQSRMPVLLMKQRGKRIVDREHSSESDPSSIDIRSQSIIFSEITRIVAQPERFRRLDPEFFDRLLHQPVMCFTTSLKVEANPTCCREFTFQDKQLPLSLPGMVGLSAEASHRLQMRDFAEDILCGLGKPLPGVSHFNHVCETLEQKGLELTMENIFELALGICDSMSVKDLTIILGVCWKFGMKRLPGSSRDILLRRFNFAEPMLKQFGTLVSEYQPITTGAFPNDAILLTNHEAFYQRGHEILGVKQETDHILDSMAHGAGAVTIVDDTSYNDDDVEGEYHCPAERVKHALVSRIMSGDVPENLKHFSVVGLNFQQGKSTLQALMEALFPSKKDNSEAVQQIRELVVKVLNYNPDSILFINATHDDVDSSILSKLVNMITELGIKVVVRTSRPVPGIDFNVCISAITKDELIKRVEESVPEMELRFALRIPKSLVAKIIESVITMRSATQDPLHLVLETISHAAHVAQSRNQDEVDGAMVAQALSFTVDTIDPRTIKSKREALRSLPGILKENVVGHNATLDQISQLVTGHLIGTTNPERPLAIMLPGPTGVGKTWIGNVIHRHFSLPLLFIEGSQYVERHSLARLTGSPPGYADEHDGLLTLFLRQYQQGFVFIDEWDKLHPEVRMGLMNFVDAGKMTAGSGESETRRGIVIFAALNGGAERLTEGMDRREVIDCLADAFKDERGVRKPELATRFQIFPMLAIPEADFRMAIRMNLEKIGQRPALMGLQIEITDIDPLAEEYIFRECKNVCTSDPPSRKVSGFWQGPGSNNATEPRYFNLRAITRAIDSSIGSSVNNMVFSALDRSPDAGVEPMFMRVVAGESGLLLVNSDS